MLRVLWKFPKLTLEQLELILASHFQFEARTDQEVEFYSDHGHWPDANLRKRRMCKTEMTRKQEAVPSYKPTQPLRKLAGLEIKLRHLLRELASLEIKRRPLMRELAQVEHEKYLLTRKSIHWRSRFRGGEIRTDRTVRVSLTVPFRHCSSTRRSPFRTAQRACAETGQVGETAERSNDTVTQR